MNLLSTYRYQLKDHKYPILVYYLVIVCLLLVMGGALMVTSPDPSNSGLVSTGGFEFATIIFLFIVGLCTFKETFLLMVQNSVSRKTMFVGKLATMLTVALLMSLLDTILRLCTNLLLLRGDVSSLYEQFFHSNGQVSTVQLYFGNYFLEVCAALAAMAVGYFITIMFYRLERTGKVIVGAGVPVALLIVLPLIDAELLGARISNALLSILQFVFSSSAHLIGASLITFAVFTVLSYLLMSRASVRD